MNWYDYGARFYDPAIARFSTTDPLSEWHFNYTPYHYTFNNPISFIDPFGMDTIRGGVVHIPEITVTAEREGTAVEDGTDTET
ncbi:MAG TPA: RHS repeat-associated core domain-containing protein, partial [Bacteroidales bacterium]|nr:RHS repeat-associated core domain-containing protein [Bacteroidales bacterium]